MKKLILVLLAMVIVASAVFASGEIRLEVVRPGFYDYVEFGSSNGHHDSFEMGKDEYHNGSGLYFEENGTEYDKLFKGLPRFNGDTKEWKLIFEGTPYTRYIMKLNPNTIPYRYKQYHIDCDGYQARVRNWNMRRQRFLFLDTDSQGKFYCDIVVSAP